MLKQYLISKTFTRGDTPLEYVYKVANCDMRTRKSRLYKKYEWNATSEVLFCLVANFNFAVKNNIFGEIRLIAPDGKAAYDFYRAIECYRHD